MDMNKSTGKRSLEGYKIFPYIAWGLTFVFALFVYNITNELQGVTSQLQTQADQLQVQIDNSNTADADFDAYQESRYGAKERE